MRCRLAWLGFLAVIVAAAPASAARSQTQAPRVLQSVLTSLHLITQPEEGVVSSASAPDDDNDVDSDGDLIADGATAAVRLDDRSVETIRAQSLSCASTLYLDTGSPRAPPRA